MKDAASDSAPANDPREIIYLVDDDVSHLRSLARLLRAAGFEVVIHDSAAEFLAELKPGMDGCVITDLMMPGIDGMDLQQGLLAAGNPLPVIFLSGHGDIPTSVQAMRSGAEDFLTKHAPKEKIFEAIRRALARNATDRARRARIDDLRRPFAQLTEREREVLRQVVQGKLNKQIAADLGLHERTVKFHRSHLTTKLGVHSVAELTRMADEAGIFG